MFKFTIITAAAAVRIQSEDNTITNPLDATSFKMDMNCLDHVKYEDHWNPKMEDANPTDGKRSNDAPFKYNVGPMSCEEEKLKEWMKVHGHRVNKAGEQCGNENQPCCDGEHWDTWGAIPSCGSSWHVLVEEGLTCYEDNICRKNPCLGETVLCFPPHHWNFTALSDECQAANGEPKPGETPPNCPLQWQGECNYPGACFLESDYVELEVDYGDDLGDFGAPFGWVGPEANFNMSAPHQLQPYMDNIFKTWYEHARGENLNKYCIDPRTQYCGASLSAWQVPVVDTGLDDVGSGDTSPGEPGELVAEAGVLNNINVVPKWFECSADEKACLSKSCAGKHGDFGSPPDNPSYNASYLSSLTSDCGKKPYVEDGPVFIPNYCCTCAPDDSTCTGTQYNADALACVRMQDGKIADSTWQPYLDLGDRKCGKDSSDYAACRYNISYAHAYSILQYKVNQYALDLNNPNGADPKHSSKYALDKKDHGMAESGQLYWPGQLRCEK